MVSLDMLLLGVLICPDTCVVLTRSPGGWQDETWPDGWTAVTRDGKRSAQFEHTLLVTETGCEILTCRLDDKGDAHFISQT